LRRYFRGKRIIRCIQGAHTANSGEEIAAHWEIGPINVELVVS
jgi:hypothetical protein